MDKRRKTARNREECRTLEAVLAEISATLRTQESNATDVNAIVALYGSIMSLCARAKRVSAILHEVSIDGKKTEVHLDEINPKQVREFSGFFKELLEFGRCMNTVSMSIIDIFHPGLKDDLMAVIGCDVSFSYYYTRELVPKYGLTEESLPLTLVNLLDRFSGDSGPRNSGGHLMLEFSARGSSEWDDFCVSEDRLFYHHRDIPTAVLVDDFLQISAGLDRCRDAIAKIVRDHWDFRDLTTPATTVSVRVEGDFNMSETRYEVSHSQVGAVGPNAHVQDVQFHQVELAGQSIDTSTLATELYRLREELGKLASDRDHYATLVAVSDAAVDANAGDRAGALKKLAGVGKWAFDVATKIGVSVAADALKLATGLK